jgi:hypothetical protein
MGKVFITDEVNDNYTADVTNAGKVKIETGAASFKACSSAHGLVCAESIVQTAAWLKRIIIGKPLAATATALQIYNTTEVSCMSGFGTSGDNVVGVIILDSSSNGISGGPGNPISVPFDVYCSSGISVGVGISAGNLGGGRIGALPGNYTVVYQA